MTAAPLQEILRHLNSAPSRTWSLVITLFGDAVVPRGGAIGLATLTEILRAMGVAEGAVRTAMSRLSADGWLDRSRQGRNSFYQLASKGQAVFADAAARIYGPPPAAGDTRLRLVLADTPDAQAALRQAGFGALPGGFWLAPERLPVPPEAAGAIALLAEASGKDAARLAAQAWPLAALADSYRHFIAAFAPLDAWLRDGNALPGIEALMARVLLVHEYRRVVLRHPPLPLALLPPDWPGEAARALCGRLYAALLPASETWLDAHGLRAEGALPPAGAELRGRFGVG